MKKVLLINGSPKGKLSNTLKLTRAFIKGLNSNDEYEVEEVECAGASINDCKGCFYCWRSREEKCVFIDDMEDILRKYVEADIVIWSFPVYFYGMPAIAKRLLDRLLPLYSGELLSMDGVTTYHPCRYDLSHQRYILFSTCAYYNRLQNVEALEEQFRLLYSDRCEMLFCTEGQLLSNNFMDYCTEDYLKSLEEEGSYYRENLHFSEMIKKKFSIPFLPIDKFMEFVEASPEIGARDKVGSFFKGLSLTYEPERLRGDRSVLEIQIKDKAYICQLHMDKKKCVLVESTEHFVPYRLKIVADFDFFRKNPNLVGKRGNRGPDFNTILEMVNKYEAKGISKELRFC